MSTEDEIAAIGEAARTLQGRIRAIQTSPEGQGEPLATHLAEMWSGARNLENAAKRALSDVS